MKNHLYTSSFSKKNLFLGILLSLLIILFISYIVNFIIQNSSYRLSMIYGSHNLNYKNYFLGNSRSVPFNQKNLNHINYVYNLSHNSMNYFEVENIIKTIKKKQPENKNIFIEITSLIHNDIQCQYSIFSHLNFYPSKKNIIDFCKKKFFLEKFFPIIKVNDEIFYRVFYYFVFPKKDQEWSNNYAMPKSTCDEPNITPFLESIIDINSIKIMKTRAEKLDKLYSDNITRIFFYITPVYSKTNYALNIEKELLKNSPKNFLRLNSLLNKNFYKDCNMFADTLHLSKSGVSMVDKILFHDKKIFH